MPKDRISSILLICLGVAALATPGRVRADTVSKNAIVEVFGGLRGTGTIVKIGDQVRVLTNSHVLLDQTEASLKVATDSKSSATPATLKARVEFNSPLDDIAVLKLENGPSAELLSQLSDAAAVEFCAPARRGCSEGMKTAPLAKESGNSPRSNFYNRFLADDMPRIATFRDGTPHEERPLFPYAPRRLPDQALSGEFSEMVRLPLLAIPGMSGGAYFEKSGFAGMLSKIELGGAGEAYAIPAHEIARVLNQQYFGTPPANQPKAHWQKTARGYRLHISTFDGHQLDMPFRTHKLSPIGGDVGNSGGDVGNSGGRRSSLWNLRIELAEGIREFQMLDPFSASSDESFQIDGKPVSYFRVRTKNGRSTYVSPTLAHYFALKKSSVPFETVFQGKESLDELMKARQAQNPLRYGRLYQKTGPGRFTLKRGFTEGSLLEGAQILKRDPCTPQAASPSREELEELQRNLLPVLSRLLPGIENGFLKEDELSRMQEFLPDQFPFQTISDPASLSAHRVRLASRPATLRIPRDLGAVEFDRVTERTQEKQRLLPESSQASPTVRYTAPGAAVRAAIIYNSQDMSRIERVLIESPDHLIELVGCRIGVECYR